LRYQHQAGAVQGQCAHVLGEVPVVTNRDPDSACPGVIDRRAGVPRRVVVPLVEAFVVGDVDHARPPEQGAIGVNYRRGVVTAWAVALVQVEDYYDAKLSRLRGERLGGRSGDRLGQPLDAALRATLRVERLERQLGEADEVGPVRRRGRQRLQAPLDVHPL